MNEGHGRFKSIMKIEDTEWYRFLEPSYEIEGGIEGCQQFPFGFTFLLGILGANFKDGKIPVCNYDCLMHRKPDEAHTALTTPK